MLKGSARIPPLTLELPRGRVLCGNCRGGLNEWAPPGGCRCCRGLGHVRRRRWWQWKRANLHRQQRMGQRRLPVGSLTAADVV